MDARLIHEEAGAQTFVLIFESGDEAFAGLSRFARERELAAAHFTGIGAFSDVVLGYFDWEAKKYRPIRIDEQVEVVALVGDVAVGGGESPRGDTPNASRTTGGTSELRQATRWGVRSPRSVVACSANLPTHRGYDAERPRRTGSKSGYRASVVGVATEMTR